MVEPQGATLAVGQVCNNILVGYAELTRLKWTRLDETIAVNILDYAKQCRADKLVPICSRCYTEDNALLVLIN